MIDFKDNINDSALQRKFMIERDLRGSGITDPAVLRAMGQLPREAFVPPKYASSAYVDGPLPIGLGQTISQPYIVALMTQKLRLNQDCTVLEIGTGCGYQAAVLAKIAKRVYTIERLAQLSEMAQAILGNLRISNVEFAIGDGSKGWPGGGKFDRIIFTAAVPTLPDCYAEQLNEGGIIVGPVGESMVQTLYSYEKIEGRLKRTFICDVRFVKLIGEYGFSE